MEALRAFWSTLGPWWPAVAFLVIVGLVVVVSRRRLGATASAGFNHQVLMAGLPLLAAPLLVLVLPISETTRGQLLALIGVLFSAAIALSSTTFVGNAMAGMLLRGIGNFRPGDLLEVEAQFGRVVTRGLFHTEIQTPTRDLVTLPNLYLVTNPVKVIRSSGTIVDAEVSLGYDVPHPRVEQLLLQAAEAAKLQESFVSVLELGDFSVVYRVSGLLLDPLKLLSTRSALRKHMLDALHEAGIEIVSPRFMITRAQRAEEKVVPEHVHPTPDATPAAAPEALMFDKAEEAATTERLRELHAEVSGRLEGTEEGEARAALLARQARLAAAIAAREDQPPAR